MEAEDEYDQLEQKGLRILSEGREGQAMNSREGAKNSITSVIRLFVRIFSVILLSFLGLAFVSVLFILALGMVQTKREPM